MGLGKFERAIFYTALRNKIVNTPFASAYRIQMHKPRSSYEPADRQDYEIDILEDNPKGEETIWEIKDIADAKAIGQLFLYELLLKKIVPYDSKKVNKGILCTECPNEIKELCEKLQIKVVILDKPSPESLGVKRKKVASLNKGKELGK
jgi:hypothetical protein